MLSCTASPERAARAVLAGRVAEAAGVIRAVGVWIGGLGRHGGVHPGRGGARVCVEACSIIRAPRRQSSRAAPRSSRLPRH